MSCGAACPDFCVCVSSHTTQHHTTTTATVEAVAGPLLSGHRRAAAVEEMATRVGSKGRAREDVRGMKGGVEEKKRGDQKRKKEQQHEHKRDGHHTRRGPVAQLPSPSKVAGSFERGELLDAPTDQARDDKWQFLFGSDVLDTFPHPTTARRRFNEDGG